MLQIPIIYEDKYLLVVNKPHGIIVEHDLGGHRNVLDTLAMQFKGTYKGNNIIRNVHRIDRRVSGALLIARKQSALKLLNEQFATRQVKKTYFALVSQLPPASEATLSHWLIKDNVEKRAFISDRKFKESTEAQLSYKMKAQVEGKILLEIDLITGKYHQIRAQLAHIGCPVIGDVKYGSKDIYMPDAIALHAESLTFPHPIEQTPMSIHAPTPSDPLWDLFR